MSWPVVELGSVVTFIGGSQPPKSTFKYELEDGYVRLLQIRDYKSDDNLTYIPESSTKKFCSKDDVMIGRYGPPVFQILRGLEGAYNVALMKAQPSEKVDRDYLFYFLKQEKLFRLIDGLSQRTAGQSGVDMNALKAYPMLLPPLEEQKRIAAILDKADAIRRKRQQATQLADDFLRSVFLDMFGDPVTNPMGWEVKQLNDVATKITDGTHDTPSKVNEGVKFVTGKNIRPFKLDLTDLKYVTQYVHEEIYNRCNPEYGDLLLTNIGAGTGNACFNSLTEAFSMKNVALVKSSPNKLSGRFLEYLFNHEGFKSKLLGENSKGGAQKFLSLKVIREASIPVPTFKEQLKFSAIVEKVKNGNLLDPNLSLKKVELFDSLSQKAFAGEL
ncbi:restriction endonuclease subunit S [Pseudoalteromonas sp. S4741]|uniref:restriction endonuclease subunit S n=1 Tax=Pseudoalteromonas sp. S4741 TaxID=579563 RepID=UPI00110A4A38|nr:restriction endonuclease subunit S [Pseudoalteromonas sp. S4741]TMO21485.1 restriction endonuclease subunit S [Pseudoalteromonas sp. S4741]